MALANSEKLKHETVMDVTEEQVARVYAQAFMGVTAGAANPGDLVEELVSLVTDVIGSSPQLTQVLESTLVSHEQKEKLLDRIFGRRASTQVLNFLKVLSKHGRLSLLRSIARQVKKLHAQRSGLTDVELRVATDLDDRLRGEIEDQLRKLLKSEPVVNVVVDPALLAGIVIRVGDRVYDGSVHTRLEHARQAMIARATESIETRPDRFMLT
jgi:F-type H+-transporting ATPase subunit delta